MARYGRRLYTATFAFEILQKPDVCHGSACTLRMPSSSHDPNENIALVRIFLVKPIRNGCGSQLSDEESPIHTSTGSGGNPLVWLRNTHQRQREDVPWSVDGAYVSASREASAQLADTVSTHEADPRFLPLLTGASRRQG